MGPAFADDQSPIAGETSSSNYGWTEVSGGADAARDQWLLYSGTTIAPWSRDIYTEGWRLRFGGGYGQYGYDASHATSIPCGVPPFPACVYESNHYTVEHSYAEALLGYYLQLGQLTPKAFAGASMSSEHQLKIDPSNHNDGTEWGAKVALELWLNTSEETWTSLDLGYSTARNESASRWRAGWRIAPKISLGPELRYDKNVETGDGDWNGRAGLFARYEWFGGEASLAGGAAWWVDGWTPKEASAYGTANLLFQY